MSHRTNITRIKAVNNALADLKDNFVFVGGATVSLYADRMAEEVRRNLGSQKSKLKSKKESFNS